MLLPIAGAEQRWVRLLSDAVSARQPIGLFLQRDAEHAGHPDLASCTTIGTAANIVRLLKLPDGSLQVLLQGAARIRLGAADPDRAVPARRLRRSSSSPTDAQSTRSRRPGQQPAGAVPARGAAVAGAARRDGDRRRQHRRRRAAWPTSWRPTSDIERAQRQEMLEELDPLARARKVTELVTRELEVLEIGSKIQSQIRESMDKSQRDFYLRQQLQAIRKELGETDETRVGAGRPARTAGQGRACPTEAQQRSRPRARAPGQHPDRQPRALDGAHLPGVARRPAVERRHRRTTSTCAHAKRVLDEDHFDLNRVKDRILEYLAVMKLRAERDAETDGAGCADRFCAWSGRPAWARPAWASRSAARWGASSCT